MNLLKNKLNFCSENADFGIWIARGIPEEKGQAPKTFCNQPLGGVFLLGGFYKCVYVGDIN